MALLYRVTGSSWRAGRRLWLVLLLGPLSTAPLYGQARDSLCGAALQSLQPRDLGSTCRSLSAFIVDALTEARFAPGSKGAGKVAPRDVQPAASGDAGGAGSLAQGEAVPGVRPVALAGGTVSAVGTDAGTRAMTSIALNPLVLLGDLNDPKAVAGPSRFADLTLLLPVDKLDANHDGRIDYFGVRSRINVLGIKAGSELFKDVEAAADSAMVHDVKLAVLIRHALENAPEGGVKQCAEALLKATPGATITSEHCGAPVSFDLDTAAVAKLREKTRTLREAADRDYFGLDLRFDTGDPTLGDSLGRDATSLLAGLAWGRKLTGTGGTEVGLKLRLGARYVSLRDTSATKLGADGGLGFELTRRLNEQTIRIDAGFEFGYGNADKALEVPLQTDFLTFRGSLSIPLANSTNVTVTLSAPVHGDQSPTLSISGNWAMLFSALAPAKR